MDDHVADEMNDYVAGWDDYVTDEMDDYGTAMRWMIMSPTGWMIMPVMG